MDIAQVFSGFAVGALVGITGVGGGALMTPLLVLLFGVSRDGNALNGTAVSEQLRGYLLAATVPEFASGLDIRPYIGGRSDGEPGDVKVELFLFSGSR